MSTVNTVMQLAETGKADQLREDMRLKALGSLYYFSKVILGYRELSEGLHLPFCDHVQSTSLTIRKRGYLMPRGHFKSTIVAKSYPLWRLLPIRPEDRDVYEFLQRTYRTLPSFDSLLRLHDPNTRIAIVGESDTVAGKNLRDPKWHIRENQIFQWLFPELIPADFNKTKWTDTEILLPRSRTFDESTITTVGVGAKSTGFHYDIIIYDDMIGEKAAKSAAEMQSAIEWFQYAPGLLNDPKHGEELLIGTRWRHGTADIYGWIMENLKEGTLESGRSTGFTWYIRPAIENNEPIFPERFTLEVLEEIRKREGDYKYNCQYMNDPTSPEGTDYPPEWIQEFEIGEDMRSIVYTEYKTKERKVRSLESLLRMSFFDPSAGGKSAGAENAIVVAGMSAEREIFILDAWSANCGLGAAIEMWYLKNDLYRCYKNYYEQVGAYKSVEEIIKLIQNREAQVACRACGKTHRRLIPHPYKPDGRVKEDRIRAYSQEKFENHRVYIRKGLAKLRAQIIAFPFGDLVDQFDAAAYLCHLLRAPMSDEQVREIRERDTKQKAVGSSYTNTGENYGGYGA
jgi:hypothetical protein